MGAATDRRDEMIKRVMERLDEILCSYQGRGHQSVYIDLDSLVLFSGLILYGQVRLKIMNMSMIRPLTGTKPLSAFTESLRRRPGGVWDATRRSSRSD